MGKRPKKRLISPIWIIILVFLFFILSLYRLILCLNPEVPRLNYVIVKKNQSIIKLLDGEKITLKPHDTFRIIEISTNICFNQGVRLYSPSIDIETARYEPCTIEYLAGNLNIFLTHSYNVIVKRYTKSLGGFTVVVKLEPRDFIERAERIISVKKRIAFLEKAHRIYPENNEIEDMLINDYKAAKKWNNIISLVKGSKKTKKNLRLLLEAYEKTNNKKGIIATAEKLLKIAPNDIDLIIRLASINEESGNIREAIRYYKMAIPMIEENQRAEIYKSIGYLSGKTGNLKDSISYYKKAYKLTPDDPDILYSLADLYRKTGKKREAERYLSLAIKSKPEDIESRLTLSEQLIKEGKLTSAKKYLKEVLEKRSDSRDALLLLLKIAEKQGNKKEQKEIYRKLIKIKTPSPVLFYNLGALEYETGNPRSALNYIKKYLRKRPNDPDARELLFNIYRKLKQNKEAIKSAINLLKLKPHYIEPYNFIFTTSKDKNLYSELIPFIKKGLKKSPGSKQLQDYLIFVYLELGKDDLALKEMKSAVRKRPEDIPLLLQMGKLYEKMGKTDSAMDIYRKIINISPKNQKAKDNFKRLALALAGKYEKEGRYKSAMKYYKILLNIFPEDETAQEGYLRVKLKTLPENNE